MTDQGFGQQRSLVDQRVRAEVRYVPIGPVALTGTEANIALVPTAQMMKIGQLAISNPTAAAISLSLYVTPSGGAKIAQLVGLSVPANDAKDITTLVGGLYNAKAVLSALGDGLIISGWYEARL